MPLSFQTLLVLLRLPATADALFRRSRKGIYRCASFSCHLALIFTWPSSAKFPGALPAAAAQAQQQRDTDNLLTSGSQRPRPRNRDRKRPS